jgi:hypothetical protein
MCNRLAKAAKEIRGAQTDTKEDIFLSMSRVAAGRRRQVLSTVTTDDEEVPPGPGCGAWHGAWQPPRRSSASATAERTL